MYLLLYLEAAPGASKRPTRGTPGHQRDAETMGPCTEFGVYNFPAGQTGADRPATSLLYTIRKTTPWWALVPSAADESILLFSALGGTIPVREPGWGALPWAKLGSEFTCQDFMFLLGGPPPFLGRNSLSSFAGHYKSHIPISHTDSGAGTASRTSPGPA